MSADPQAIRCEVHVGRCVVAHAFTEGMVAALPIAVVVLAAEAGKS
jgi:hypothetical protein